MIENVKQQNDNRILNMTVPVVLVEETAYLEMKNEALWERASHNTNSKIYVHSSLCFYNLYKLL